MTNKTLAVIFFIFSTVATGASGNIAGLWNATLRLGTTDIPFQMGFSGTGDDVKGWFFNGKSREVSNNGSYRNGALVLRFDSYASVLNAAMKDGALVGAYTQRGKSLPIHAVRFSGEPDFVAKGPDIHGLWILENVQSNKKNEQAWSLIVQQNGVNVAAAILRVDGDTGALTGGYKDGKFVLSHFSGARPSKILITPETDGSLSVELFSQHHSVIATAYRPNVAREKGLPQPVDASQHTGVRDATQPFAFSFPDLNGNLVSNTDERFRNKVVLINITGSWCPNCHDEAPFLTEIYRKFHSRGLEIVALSFEEPEQLQNPARLRALIKEFGIPYTVLLGGTTDSAKDKLTNTVNWDSWPTTFFVGRDGLVQSVHTGFPGPASGELYTKTKEEFVANVERLLAGNELSSR